MAPKFLALSLFLLISSPLLLLSSCFPSPSPSSLDSLNSIDHFIVLYFENQSFDFLLGTLPNVAGLAEAVKRPKQTDKKGELYEKLPSDNVHSLPNDQIPNSPFDGRRFIPPNATTLFQVTHRFYIEQYQLNCDKNGLECRNDRYAAWSEAGGWVMAFYDMMDTYVGELAMKATVLDHFYHSAFGGSFLNHQWLIAARSPPWTGAQPPANWSITHLDSQGIVSNGRSDGILTPDLIAVNSVFSVNPPHPPPLYKDQLELPSLNHPTIGDHLTSAGVSWAYYAQYWNDANAQPRGPKADHYQYHHQPFVYFDRFKAENVEERQRYLKDEIDFFAALESGNLPSVSFVKPGDDDDFHPTQNNPAAGAGKLKEYIEAIQASQHWKSGKTMIIVTFDENGGLYDHVAPPKGDRWGPGSRVPTIILAPKLKPGVIHSNYETISILKMLKTRFALSSSCISDVRDSTVNDLTNIFAESIEAFTPNNNLNLRAKLELETGSSGESKSIPNSAYNVGNLMILLSIIGFFVGLKLLYSYREKVLGFFRGKSGRAPTAIAGASPQKFNDEGDVEFHSI